MITSAPLFSFCDATTALLGTPLADDALARPWMLGDETPAWYGRTAWAIAAISKWASNEAGHDACLWLPDYFCNQSTDPARRAGAQVVFYPVCDTLEPDWAACRVLAKKHAPDVFMLVHYFGHPNDGAGARSFCDDHNALLVEDAAHVLRPCGDIGTHGDVTCYSPHKLFAIPDGGLMLARHKGFAAWLNAQPAPHPAAPAGRWFLRRAVQSLLPNSLLAARTRNADVHLQDDPAYVSLPDTPGLSPMAARLLRRVTTRLGRSAQTRQDNAVALTKAFASVDSTSPLFESTTAPPYRWALRCHNETRASTLFDILRTRGCPVETWPDMAPEVIAAPDQHAEALRLRQTVLTFPVHTKILPDTLDAWTRP